MNMYLCLWVFYVVGNHVFLWCNWKLIIYYPGAMLDLSWVDGPVAKRCLFEWVGNIQVGKYTKQEARFYKSWWISGTEDEFLEWGREGKEQGEAWTPIWLPSFANCCLWMLGYFICISLHTSRGTLEQFSRTKYNIYICSLKWYKY